MVRRLNQSTKLTKYFWSFLTGVKYKMFKKKNKPSHFIKDSDDQHHFSSSENLTPRDGKEMEKHKALYEVHFLGIVPDIIMSHSQTRDKEAQLVDRVEEAQIESRIPISAQEEDKVMINISIHGIKVIDMKGQEVLQRHPLHTLAQVVQYNDGTDVNNIVLKIGNVNKAVFSAYVFQCLSEEQAQNICQNVKDMFDKVTDKVR